MYRMYYYYFLRQVKQSGVILCFFFCLFVLPGTSVRFQYFGGALCGELLGVSSENRNKRQTMTCQKNRSFSSFISLFLPVKEEKIR